MKPGSDNLSRLADAVGAEFRANDWHQRRTVTEIQKHEVGVLPDGRYALRLQLWPFYKFAIEFSAFSLVEVPRSARGPPERDGSPSGTPHRTRGRPARRY
jgi:hypothetical protein